MAGKVTIIREYFSIKELSLYCGLGERTLRDLINCSITPIPCFRFGRAIRVKKEEFDQWAKSFCRNDNDKIDKIVDELMRDLGIRSKSRAGKSGRKSQKANEKRQKKPGKISSPLPQK